MTAEQGGVHAPDATARGPGTTVHGMKGGTGPNNAMGVPSGWALIPLINIPASLRHLTDTLLIMNDANPGQLATNWMSKITSRTTVYRIRKRLSRDAAKYARERIKQHAGEIERALRKMTARERDMAINRWKWEIQRQYFARVEKGAAAKLHDMGLTAEELHQAQILLEAAKAKPLAGQLPRNHKFAGKAFPPDRLPEAYRGKGLRFTEDGFPDFGPYAQTLPNGQKSVKLQLTGNYKHDVKLANEAAKLDVTPGESAWHHLEDGETMILVPKTLHETVRHSGGRATFKHRTGDASAYP